MHFIGGHRRAPRRTEVQLQGHRPGQKCSVGQAVGRGTFIYAWWGCNTALPLPRTTWRYLRIRPRPLPCDPANPPLRTSPEIFRVYPCTALGEKLMGNVVNGCIRPTTPEPTDNLHTAKRDSQRRRYHHYLRNKLSSPKGKEKETELESDHASWISDTSCTEKRGRARFMTPCTFQQQCPWDERTSLCNE